MKINYYKELDGIRAIAAIMIIVFHFFEGAGDHSALYALLKKMSAFGQTGVSLFFVLSGFLITRILIASKQKPKFFFNFYLRRSLRIFPLYYGFLIVYYFLICPFFLKIPVPGLGVQIYYWLYLQDFADTFNWQANGPFHFWSLAIEEHFYLFWPFLVYYLENKKIFISVIAIIFISFITRLILLFNHHEVFYFTFTRMDELAIGAILALMEINNKLIPKNAKIFLRLFVGILIPAVCMWFIFTGLSNPFIQLIKFALISFSFFSLIAYVISVKSDHVIKKVLTLRPFLFTGKISYGLYVYHPLGYGLFIFLLKPHSLLFTFFGGLAFTYLIAFLSYNLFEARFLSLKKYFE